MNTLRKSCLILLLPFAGCSAMEGVNIGASVPIGGIVNVGASKTIGEQPSPAKTKKKSSEESESQETSSDN